jgi:hypothetical protein
MDRAAYRDLFHLNETEADRISRLVPKQEMLVKRPDGSKILSLNVDRVGYWLYTNNPHENARKREAIARYGFERGLQVLAQEQS